jgi:hypothetical protein
VFLDNKGRIPELAISGVECRRRAGAKHHFIIGSSDEVE